MRRLLTRYDLFTLSIALRLSLFVSAACLFPHHLLTYLCKKAVEYAATVSLPQQSKAKERESMPLAINTQFQPLYLSSALPETVSFSAQDENTAADVSVIIGSTTVFQTTLYAYGHNMTLHDIRSIIEDAIREDSNAFASCRVSITDGSDTVQSPAFVVVISDITIPTPADFLLQNFLTTRHSFRIFRNGRQTLSWFSQQGEQVTAWIEATIRLTGSNRTSVYLLNQTTQHPTTNTIYQYAVNVAELQQQVQSQGKLLSFKVVRGQRSISFYVTDETPSLTISFLNNFNVVEQAEIYGTTTIMQKVESNEARCGRQRMLFDRTTTHSVEVETTALTYDEGLWLRQLLASRFISIPVSNTAKEVLIDSSELEISDDNSAMNRMKLTYKYAKDTQYL